MLIKKTKTFYFKIASFVLWFYCLTMDIHKVVLSLVHLFKIQGVTPYFFAYLLVNFMLTYDKTSYF